MYVCGSSFADRSASRSVPHGLHAHRAPPTLRPPFPPPQPLRSTNLVEIVPQWDANFVEVEQEILFELILAANYMDIKSLLDLTCAKVASMIKGERARA